jgi:hypothetical protein
MSGDPETGFVRKGPLGGYDPRQDSSIVGSPVAALFMDGRLAINKCGLQLEPAGAGGIGGTG